MAVLPQNPSITKGTGIMKYEEAVIDSCIIRNDSALMHYNYSIRMNGNMLREESRGYRLNPLNDYLFKQYMGTEGCKICLLSFLRAVLKEEIEDAEIIENLELPKENPDGKFSRLDIRAKLPDGTQINIEVQLLDEHNMVKRSQYYNGRLYVSGITKGEDYSKLGRVISINIMNFNYLDCPEFHTSSRFRLDQHPEKILSNDQELHFLELKKFYQNADYDINNPLHRWLMFFNRNLRNDQLKELIQMDGAIRLAEEKSRQVAASEKEMRLYEAMEDARRNRISAQNYFEAIGEQRGETKGITIGAKIEAAKFAQLVKYLLADSRMEELERITEDEELREQLYREYGIS